MADTVTFSAQRAFGTIEIDCSIEEGHVDALTITEHPVEQGANISDHAYRNAARLTVRAAWSNSSLQSGGSSDYVQDTYDALLALQATRQPFQVMTGKRIYPSMLFETLSTATDQGTQEALVLTATLKELITVQTQATTLPDSSVQASPQATAPPVNAGSVQAAPVSITPAAAPALVTA